MDNFSLTLPSGHIVTLKKGLTYRASRAIQNALMGDMVIQVTPGQKSGLEDQVLEVKFANIQAYQDEALRHLLISVVAPDGSTATEPYDAVMELEESDAQIVMDKVTELTDSKKKSKTSS